MMKSAKTMAGNEGKLIIGILTDEAVMEKKPRPILSFGDRFELASALVYPDIVVPQYTYSPLQNLMEMKPDVLMESTSHDENEIKKATIFMESIKGKVIVLPYFPPQIPLDFENKENKNYIEPIAEFAHLKDIKWKEITMNIYYYEKIKIEFTARNIKTGKQPAKAFGFECRGKPGKLWQLLIDFYDCKLEISKYSTHIRTNPSKLKDRVSRLRVHLRKLINIEDGTPISSYNKNKAYCLRFNINVEY
jgi:glycerol-3-phosphate cytidylyltransferase-like family protein